MGLSWLGPRLGASCRLKLVCGQSKVEVELGGLVRCMGPVCRGCWLRSRGHLVACSRVWSRCRRHLGWRTAFQRLALAWKVLLWCLQIVAQSLPSFFTPI